MPIVYLLTNIVNGKKYIGATTASAERRRTELYSKARSKSERGKHTKLSKDMRIFKKSHFEISILECCDNIDAMFEAEKYWIAKLDSINEGYNHSAGGIGNDSNFKTKESIQKSAASKLGVKRKPFSLLTKKRMSESAKKRWTAEYKQTVSDRMKRSDHFKKRNELGQFTGVVY